MSTSPGPDRIRLSGSENRSGMGEPLQLWIRPGEQTGVPHSHAPPNEFPAFPGWLKRKDSLSFVPANHRFRDLDLGCLSGVAGVAQTSPAQGEMRRGK